MHWKIKCLAFHTLARLPPVHRFVRRKVTGRYFFDVTDAELQSYRWHLSNFRGGVAVEFGAGANLLTALLLSQSGATELYALDIARLASVPQINHVIRQLCGRVAGAWPEIAHLDDLRTLYRIRYEAPADMRGTRFAPHSVDFICSTSVLEHIPEPDIRAILKFLRSAHASRRRMQ